MSTRNAPARTHALSLELAKLRRKRVPLVVMTMVGATLAWVAIGARQEGAGSPDGWSAMLYSAPLINAIFLSLLASVVSSRVIDVDHEASAWKQLLCLQPARQLLFAKLACAALIMAMSVALETAGMLAIGHLLRFPGLPGLPTWLTFAGSQFASCLVIVTIIQAVAIRWENQFVSMSVGLALSLAGLFAGLFPEVVLRLVPSGYFMLLSTMRINWDAAATTHQVSYYQTAFSWGDLALLVVVCAVAVALSFRSFSRRELGAEASGSRRQAATASGADPRGGTVSTRAEDAPAEGAPAPHARMRQGRTSALRAELIKLRRAPVWLAFVALPLISAVIGTFNYQANLGILTPGWFNLWTQQTLFLGLFFLQALVGVQCSWLMRLEHTGTNWNQLMSAPVSVVRLLAAKLVVGSLMFGVALATVGGLFVAGGKLIGIPGMPEAEYAQWLALAWVGGVALVACQLLISLLVRNFAVPVGVAVIGGLVGFNVYARGGGLLFPYALTQMALNSNGHEALPAGQIPAFLASTALFATLALGIACWHLSHRDVRTS